MLGLSVIAWLICFQGSIGFKTIGPRRFLRSSSSSSTSSSPSSSCGQLRDKANDIEWQDLLSKYDGKKIDKYYSKRPLQVRNPRLFQNFPNVSKNIDVSKKTYLLSTM